MVERSRRAGSPSTQKAGASTVAIGAVQWRVQYTAGEVVNSLPELTLKAVLYLGDKTDDGQFVLKVLDPWFDIVRMILQDPTSAYQIGPRKFEELIAGGYERLKYFDEVILTPQSGDKGRDVIATKWGYGSVRIFDEIKANSPGNLVPASVVRAMLGVLERDRNVSKGIITTTSYFAPGVGEEFKLYMPHRLELKPLPDLLKWLGPLVARDR